MSRGLGRFERWILLHTYLKTIMHELPADWKMPAGYGAAQTRCGTSFEERLATQLGVWNGHLMRAEILLNYFGLATSDRRHSCEVAHQCFLRTPAYRTALAMLPRTLMGLQVKGHIRWVSTLPGLVSGIQWDGCWLTPLGVSTAKGLMTADHRLCNHTLACADRRSHK